MRGPHISNGDGYISFMFVPDQGEILDGVKSVYTDGLGRLHVSIGFEKNAKKAKAIQKQSRELRDAVIGALTVKRPRSQMAKGPK